MPASVCLWGGAPGNIFQRFMGAAVDTDRRAIETMGASLREGCPLVATCLAHCATLTFPVSVYANSFAFRLLQTQAHGASLEFTFELKRWPILSMVCDKECLILLHRLRQ